MFMVYGVVKISVSFKINSISSIVCFSFNPSIFLEDNLDYEIALNAFVCILFETLFIRWKPGGV